MHVSSLHITNHASEHVLTLHRKARIGDPLDIEADYKYPSGCRAAVSERSILLLS